jgi:hypothetical protein
MGKVATSAIFYRRGVPNNYYPFGALVQGNYPVVQPNTFFIDFVSYNKKSPAKYSYLNYINNK